MLRILTVEDVKWIRDNRREVTRNRQTLITIAYKSEGTVDDITGEEISGGFISREVMSVVTELTSLDEVSVERVVRNGIYLEKGDIRASIDYDYFTNEPVKIDRVFYNEQWFAILSLDRKGIGEINRIELVGRLIS